MKRNKREAGGTRYGFGAALPTAQLRVPQPIAGPRGRGPRHLPAAVLPSSSRNGCC